MDTLTKSCSPTIVITSNGEVETHEEATVYVKELEKFLTMKVLEKNTYCRSESFAMETDMPTNGSMVKKPHLIKKGFEDLAIRRTSFLLWFQACQVRPLDLHQLQRHLQDWRVIILHLLQARLLHQRQQHQVIVSLEKEDRKENDPSSVPVSSFDVDDRTETPVVCRETPKNIKETKIERGHPLFADSGRASSEIPEWLQEFREILVDDEIPLQGGTHASSSHEVSLEPTTKRREDLGKHNVHTHFAKDRNCEIWKRTTIARAPCRRRNGEAVLRAVNFGDLITADHKVLSDNCESRNNHRYAVVVQDLATQWIQSYPCRTKNFSGNAKELSKVLGTLWILAKPVEISPVVIVRRRLTVPK